VARPGVGWEGSSNGIYLLSLWLTSYQSLTGWLATLTGPVRDGGLVSIFVSIPCYPDFAQKTGGIKLEP
jgi:hypothetical protein